MPVTPQLAAPPVAKEKNQLGALLDPTNPTSPTGNNTVADTHRETPIIMETANTTPLHSTDAGQDEDNMDMEVDSNELNVAQIQVLKSNTNLEHETIAPASKAAESGRASSRKTKTTLDALSLSLSAAELGSSSARPPRYTGNTVPTYNLAVMNDNARQTRTKYFEKHHKNVLHGRLKDTPLRDVNNGSPSASPFTTADKRSQTANTSKTTTLQEQADPFKKSY